MTVAELIEKLKKLEDQDRLIKVWDRQVGGSRQIVWVSADGTSHDMAWIEV